MVNLKDIQVVILAGGMGTRLKEHTKLIPKPMVKILRKPILSHIIDHYEKFGLSNFIVASGYKSKYIEYYYRNRPNIKVIYTGKKTLTGGRIRRLKSHINGSFFMTYGDGISDVNIKQLYNFHLSHKKIATITAVHPISRFGELVLNKKNQVKIFNEKPQVRHDWINGGFFVFNKDIFNYLRSDQEILEKYPLQALSNENQLIAYKHNKFWHCIDTIRDIENVTFLLKKMSINIDK